MLVAGIPLGGVSVLFFRSRSFLCFFFSLALAACEKSSRDGAAVRDDFGDPVRIGAAPTRIVSLNPATTEILFTLGAGSRLIGRTKYDLWPDSAKLIPALGDGIRPNVEVVLGTHPDLVILCESGQQASGRAVSIGGRQHVVPQG